jgi:transposase
MAKAYSDDLRRKVLERHQVGEETLEDLAERFGVSLGWVKKISAAFTRTGQMGRPAPAGVGRPRKATAAIDRFVGAAIKDQPDLTLAELQLRLFQQQQLEISIGALWNLLRRLNLRLKKNHSRRRAG